MYTRATNHVNKDMRKESDICTYIWTAVTKTTRNMGPYQIVFGYNECGSSNTPTRTFSYNPTRKWWEHFITITSKCCTATTNVTESNHSRLRTFIRHRNPEDITPECISNANSEETFKTYFLEFFVKDVYNRMPFPLDMFEWLFAFGR